MEARPVSGAGAGAIVSNIKDYSKWLHALIHRTPPIPKETYEQIFTPRTLQDWPGGSKLLYVGFETYSLGWFTSAYRCYQFYEHSGGMEVFGAKFIFFLPKNYGLCPFGSTGVISESVESTAIWKPNYDMLDVPHKERFDWNADTFQEITSWPSWTRLWPPGLMIRQAVAAEFKVSSNVSSNGASSMFGIAIEPEMGLDGRIWFQIQ
ncbi:hypothetical protein PZA11_007297 [Diplocarpon coronariae]